RRERNAGRFDRHQQHDAAVASRGDDVTDEDEYQCENFFSHENSSQHSGNTTSCLLRTDRWKSGPSGPRKSLRVHGLQPRWSPFLSLAEFFRTPYSRALPKIIPS